jgi:hypothetical protein
MKSKHWNEPKDFRGVPWGASVAALKEKFGDAYCQEYEEDVTGDAICKSEFNVGEIPVKGFFSFRKKGLVRVALAFDAKQFNEMIDIFTEKYGSSTSKHQTERLKYTDETRIWKGSTVDIEANKYRDTIRQSEIVIWLVADKAVALEKLDRTRKKATEDL